VWRHGQSVQWRFIFCHIFSHVVETQVNKAAYNGVG
jgi:hypothetical protein